MTGVDCEALRVEVERLRAEIVALRRDRGLQQARRKFNRARAETAEAALLAKSAEYDALVARIEGSLVRTVEESGWGDETGDGRIYGIPDRFIGQRVLLLVSDDRPSHTAVKP